MSSESFRESLAGCDRRSDPTGFGSQQLAMVSKLLLDRLKRLCVLKGLNWT